MCEVDKTFVNRRTKAPQPEPTLTVVGAIEVAKLAGLDTVDFKYGGYRVRVEKIDGSSS